MKVAIIILTILLIISIGVIIYKIYNSPQPPTKPGCYYKDNFGDYFEVNPKYCGQGKSNYFLVK